MTTPYQLGDGVFVPARVAALLSRALDLNRRRTAWRGSDAEVDAVLQAWRKVELAFVESRTRTAGCADGFAAATADAELPQPEAQSSEEMTVSQVADLLDVTQQAVTKAARERRLAGRQIAGRWVFPTETVAQFVENRRRAR